MLREVPAAGVQQYQHLEAAQPHFITINCDSGAAGVDNKEPRNYDVARQQDY